MVPSTQDCNSNAFSSILTVAVILGNFETVLLFEVIALIVAE